MPAGPAQRSKVDSNRSDVAERAGGDQLLDGEEVAVPAPVVEHDERPLHRGGGGDERLGRGNGWCERFVDDNCSPGFQRRKPLFQMGMRGGGQHDEVEVGRPGEESVGGGHDFGIRIPGGRRERAAPGRWWR